jgi:dihydrofolate synthase/folylpolyglutamate synthase
VRYLLERIQIDGAPVDEATFCRVLGEMVPTISAMQTGEWGAPSFFEILIALSYKLFAQTPVDVVVMETGLGGRYDATNTVTRADKIALFTHIGYDHLELLGNTLSKVAMQKAGIIQRHNRVLTLLQAPDAQAMIDAESAAQEADVTVFDPATSIHAIRLQPSQVIFDLTLPTYPPLHDLQLALTGAHQAQNAGLALAAAQLFLKGIGRRLDEPPSAMPSPTSPCLGAWNCELGVVSRSFWMARTTRRRYMLSVAHWWRSIPTSVLFLWLRSNRAKTIMRS